MVLKSGFYCTSIFVDKLRVSIRVHVLSLLGSVSVNSLTFVNHLELDFFSQCVRASNETRYLGGRVVQRCWVNFQCRGVLLIWTIVGQGPIVLAVGAGGGCLDIFSLIYHFSFLTPSL